MAALCAWIDTVSDARSGAPVLQVTCGEDLLSFDATVDLHGPFAAAADGLDTQGKPGPRKPAQSGLPRPHGRMSFPGSAAARPGAMIELVGVGLRFSGKVLVRSVQHRIAGGDWTTEVGFGLPPARCSQDPWPSQGPLQA